LFPSAAGAVRARSSLVLGAGISGIAAGKELVRLGNKVTFIDRNPTIGGYSRSIYLDRFIFDYTGHFLHLARTGTPQELLGNDDARWQFIARHAYCFVAGHFTSAPFQYSLGDLPPGLRDQCLGSYREAIGTAARNPGPRNLEEYFYSHFGAGITEMFLTPYNEKIFATNLKNLAMQSIGRFFPLPDANRILGGAAQATGDAGQVGYNAKFWYPERNGIQQLVDQLAGNVSHELGNVTNIDLEERVVRTERAEYAYDRAFCSIPLDAHLGAAGYTFPGGAELRKALNWSDILSFQIGVAGDLPADLRNRHWIYVADREIPFHRVGIYSNFNRAMAPKGSYNLYVEVGKAGNTSADLPALQKDVLSRLDDLGWARASRVSVLLCHEMNPAYVLFTHDWARVIPDTLMRLEKMGMFPIGRYGRWDYISMEDSILSAREKVRTVAG
jgi:protoporphyrinogen oxidase